MLNRRDFLKGAGAGTVLVAGGVVWRSCDTGIIGDQNIEAYEPWMSWRSDKGEGPRELVRAAILAANPHNSQPWKFSVTESRIDVFADPSRNIGSIDPYLREMYIGLGCAIENLLLAAAAEGYEHDIQLMPDPTDSSHVASVELSPGGISKSELYSAIPIRHTNRGPYEENRKIPATIFRSLEGLADEVPNVSMRWFSSESEKREIAELIVRASEAIISDHEQSSDSSRWLRMSSRLIKEHRDGITVDAMGFSPAARALVKFLPGQSREKNDRAWVEMTRNIQVATAAAFGMIAVRDVSDKVQRLEGGQVYQRMHLWATKESIAMQPLSQLTERADRERALGLPTDFGNALTRVNPTSSVLMIFRIGYPILEALPSPRRGVDEVVV